MTEIWIVRHGETHWNREGRVQGYNANSPLTEAGEAQALALGRRIAGENVQFLYSSDTGRTRQTVAPIVEATGLPAAFDSSLRERNYGIFEGLTYAEVARDYPDAYARMRAHDPHFAAEGGESVLQFRDRVIDALGRVAARERGGKTVVVTHGGVLGIMYRHAMNLPLEAPRNYTIANASINRFRWESGVWQLLEWGDVSHLPEAGRPA